MFKAFLLARILVTIATVMTKIRNNPVCIGVTQGDKADVRNGVSANGNAVILSNVSMISHIGPKHIKMNAYSASIY